MNDLNIQDAQAAFLQAGKLILMQRLAYATGGMVCEPPLNKAKIDETYHQQIIDEFMPILNSAKSVEIAGLMDGSISARVDAVMQAVATGQIDIDQGKRLIEMLQAGFEITELQDLIAKLAEAGVELE